MQETSKPRTKSTKKQKQAPAHAKNSKNGNPDGFSVVRVPTEAEEQERSLTRQRESLQREKQRLAAAGRGNSLDYGHALSGDWWSQATWEEIVSAAADELPLGLGELTHEILDREVTNWDRFKNRRQVASYTGMCPWEDSDGVSPHF